MTRHNQMLYIRMSWIGTRRI